MQVPDYKLLTLGLLTSVLVCVIGHVLLARLTRSRRHIVMMLAGILTGSLLGIVWVVMGSDGLPLVQRLKLGVSGMLTGLGWMWCYFHFVNLSLTSIRVQVLSRLYEVPVGLSREALLQDYDTKVMLDRRLARMIEGGHLRVHDGRYVLGKSYFVWLFWMFELLKHVVMGRGNQLLEELNYGNERSCGFRKNV